MAFISDRNSWDNQNIPLDADLANSPGFLYLGHGTINDLKQIWLHVQRRQMDLVFLKPFNSHLIVHANDPVASNFYSCQTATYFCTHKVFLCMAIFHNKRIFSNHWVNVQRRQMGLACVKPLKSHLIVHANDPVASNFYSSQIVTHFCIHKLFLL